MGAVVIELVELLLFIVFLIVAGVIADHVVEPWLERRDARARNG